MFAGAFWARGLLGGIAVRSITVSAIAVAAVGACSSEAPVTAGAGDGSVSCARTTDELAVTVTPAAGEPPNCSMHQGTTPTEWSGIGRVVSTNGGDLVLDECSPATDCTPMLRTLEIRAPGVAPELPSGAYVSWRVRFAPGWSRCVVAVMIRNQPTWDGVPNPVAQSERVYVLGADGSLDTFADAPLSVSRRALGCGAHDGGQLAPDEYALEIDGTSELVLMGDEREVAVAGRVFSVRNLRSFQTELTDDYWNWAFWAREASPAP